MGRRCNNAAGLFALFLSGVSAIPAAPRVDNVLINMVPPGSTALVGARMEQIKTTELYRRLMAAQKLDQLDEFAYETGFDPRRDVRELLFATTPRGGVLLARGSFRLNSAALRNAKKIRHGEYDIWSRGGESGFCILDSTLAAAGEIDAVQAALDEWKSGTHTAAQPLLAKANLVDPQSQAWGFSSGLAGFLADHLPSTGSGLDLSKIFRGLQDAWFQVDLASAFRAEVHGTAASERDAVNLRDAVRGMIGLGRLNMPENQEDLLRVWDGITVDQQGRAIALKANIPQDLVGRLLQLLDSAPNRQQRRIL
jgi:hypothetical protein